MVRFELTESARELPRGRLAAPAIAGSGLFHSPLLPSASVPASRSDARAAAG